MSKKIQDDDLLTHSAISDPGRQTDALTRSDRIQRQAAAVNFDWSCAEDILQKLHEEVDELMLEVQQNNQAAMQDEMGDILFTCVNLARHLNIDLEVALQGANDKFLHRFVKVEALCEQRHIDMQQAAFDELLELWQQAKQDTAS